MSNYKLSPLKLSELILYSVRLCKDNYLLLFLVSFLPVLFASIFMYYHDKAFIDRLILMAAKLISSGVITISAVQIYIGNRISIAEAYNFFGHTLVRYIGTILFFYAIIAIIPTITLFLIAYPSMDIVNNIHLNHIISVLWGAYMLTVFGLAPEVCLIENKRAFDSLKTSAVITTKMRFYILLVVIIVFGLDWGIRFATEIVLGFPYGDYPMPVFAHFWDKINPFAELVYNIVYIIVMPFIFSLWSVLYLNLNFIKEDPFIDEFIYDIDFYRDEKYDND